MRVLGSTLVRAVVVVVAAALVLGGVTVAGPRAAAASSSPPAGDAALFGQFRLIHRVFAHRAGAVWRHDYRPDRTPAVVGRLPAGAQPGAVAPAYAYVIGHPHPAALGDAVRVRGPEVAGLPPVYRVTRGLAIDTLATVPFFDVRPLASADSIVLNAVDGDPSLDPRLPFFHRTVVHEAFHHYQTGRFTPAVPEQPDPTGYPRTPDRALALALLEGAVLDGRDTGTPASARRVLRTFLAVRAERAALQPGVHVFDDDSEQIEGTARFVEDRFGEAAGEPVRDDAVPTEPRLLLAYLAHNRGYEVGADLGRDLERVEGRHWRTQVAAGRSPAGEAARVVGVPDGARRDRLVAAAERRYDYPRLLATVRAADLPRLP